VAPSITYINSMSDEAAIHEALILQPLVIYPLSVARAEIRLVAFSTARKLWGRANALPTHPHENYLLITSVVNGLVMWENLGRSIDICEFLSFHRPQGSRYLTFEAQNLPNRNLLVSSFLETLQSLALLLISAWRLCLHRVVPFQPVGSARISNGIELYRITSCTTTQHAMTNAFVSFQPHWSTYGSCKAPSMTTDFAAPRKKIV
jgi:hypothetical protein